MPPADIATIELNVEEKSEHRLPVSVIILTFNEERNICNCLEGLDWADDVIIVDSHSTDRTLEVAGELCPTVRFFQNSFEDFGQQRNWALDQVHPRHQWILFLDADERVTAPFAAALKRGIEAPGELVGYYVCSRNFLLGRWLKHCQLYPSWQLRLLKAGKVRFQKEGHGQREVTEGTLGYIFQPLDHLNFSKGVAEWIARHNVYSSNEIELIHRLRRERLKLSDVLSFDAPRRRRCLKRLAARMGFRPLLRFLYVYVLRRGFLDGYPGLIFCLLRVAHEIHITAKLTEASYLERGMTDAHSPFCEKD